MSKTRKPRNARCRTFPNGHLRSEEEVIHALEVMLAAVSGAKTDDDKKVGASAAMALAWVLHWEGGGAEFQKIIDRCDAIIEKP